MEGEVEAGPGGRMRPAAGEWEGWTQWGDDPFEQVAGPFYLRYDEDGRPRCAFRAAEVHTNGGGFVHGGCLMTFADYCLFVIARKALSGSLVVTASFNADFLGIVRPGDLVEGAGEVVKAGRSMIFVRGMLSVGDAPVLSFSAVLKRTRKE